MTDRIIKADKKQRKTVIIIIAMGIIVGVIAWLYFQSFSRSVEELAKQSPEQALQKLFNALYVVTSVWALMILLFSGYTLWLSRLVHKAKQFPPPGMAVVKDTQVITGKKAINIAIIGYCIAGLLLICALIVPFWVRSLVKSLLFEGFK